MTTGIRANTALKLELEGHLSLAALQRALNELTITEKLTYSLLVDCSAMTGYDAAARQHFVDWNRRHRYQLEAVAVVTDRSLWHVVVSAMALASGQKMQAFAARDAALTWLGGHGGQSATG